MLYREQSRALATDKYALRFARKALAEGIEEATIMKITGLEAEYISMLKRKLLNKRRTIE